MLYILYLKQMFKLQTTTRYNSDTYNYTFSFINEMVADKIYKFRQRNVAGTNTCRKEEIRVCYRQLSVIIL
jgi:hypothetical protein